jgi:hypothetical protein
VLQYPIVVGVHPLWHVILPILEIALNLTGFTIRWVVLIVLMAVVSHGLISTYCGWCSSYFFFCLSFFLVDDGSKLYDIWHVWRPWSALCLAKPVGFYSWLQSCETLTMEKWRRRSFLHRLLSRCGPSFWMEINKKEGIQAARVGKKSCFTK